MTRSLTEIVNIVTTNADYTADFMHDVPSVVHENKYNIAYWAWELDVFPQKWMDHLKVFDEVWCPSAFVKKSITSSPGYDGTPISVLNLPLFSAEAAHHRPEEEKPGSLPYELTQVKTEGGPFTLLVVFEFQSIKERKNPSAAIRAFLEAFPAKKDPTAAKHRLVVKSHT